jgi:hypothetical protein
MIGSTARAYPASKITAEAVSRLRSRLSQAEGHRPRDEGRRFVCRHGKQVARFAM